MALKAEVSDTTGDAIKYISWLHKIKYPGNFRGIIIKKCFEIIVLR